MKHLQSFKSVILNLFFTTPPFFLYFKPPGYKQVAKAIVLFGTLIDETYNVVQRLPPGNSLTLPGGGRPPA